jgi:holliday junction DNA helicase RuvB
MNELRPTKLVDIVGQKEIKEILRISIESCKQRKDVHPHIALLGNAGIGKSTFAECISNEIGAKLHFVNGACLSSIKNLAPYIMRIKYGDVLFIDEIHRARVVCQEFMYTCLEDFFCVIGSGQDIIKVKIPHFTLIVATTEYGKLAKPFRDRIKLPLFFSLYQNSDLAELARLNAERLTITIDQDAAQNLAKRSRGTPRVLNRLLEWCRDYALTEKQSTVLTLPIVKDAMVLLDIDENGFTKDDRRVIMILEKEGKPVPLNSLSAMCGIDEKTLVEEVEPFLISKGIITKNTKGRLLC